MTTPGMPLQIGWRECWRNADGHLTDDVVQSVDRDDRGWLITVESGEQLREYKVVSVGEYKDGKLVAAWLTKSQRVGDKPPYRYTTPYGLGGRRTLFPDTDPPAPETPIERADDPTHSGILASVSADLRQEIETKFHLPPDVFDSLSDGSFSDHDLTRWAESARKEVRAQAEAHIAEPLTLNPEEVSDVNDTNFL